MALAVAGVGAMCDRDFESSAGSVEGMSDRGESLPGDAMGRSQRRRGLALGRISKRAG